MNPQIKIILSSFFLGLFVAYIIWLRWRVWILRQDLFEIRDQLWDKMRQEGKLGDSEHRIVRQTINGVIRVAPILSIITLVIALLSGLHGDSPNIHNSSAKNALNKVIVRLARYIMFETITGLLLMAFALIFMFPRFVIKNLQKALQRWMSSQEVREAPVIIG